jgi:7-cyano-7-deazaguanine synthase
VSLALKPKAVVLLSGGLDSAVTLYRAQDMGYDCHCLAFDYGQRHKKEMRLSRLIAKEAGAKFTVSILAFPWKGSSLIDNGIALPSGRTPKEIKAKGVPSTYVPARNTIFLSMAVSMAEAIGARAIFIGAHSEDSSGYPDCRIGYLKAFDNVIRLGTKAGREKKLGLKFPLIRLGKSGIIELGKKLRVPFKLTWSCYEGGKRPCGKCDSCVLRAKGFKEAGVIDEAIEG